MKHSVFLSKQEIIDAISCTSTMREASLKFDCCYRTFVEFAKKYDVYKPKQNGYHPKLNLSDILAGKYPSYPTSHLSKRLVKEGVKRYECERCKITSYNGDHIGLELDHIDGNSTNHRLENLRLLCPNCHSQTPTYRSKKLIWKSG